MINCKTALGTFERKNSKFEFQITRFVLVFDVVFLFLFFCLCVFGTNIVACGAEHSQCLFRMTDYFDVSMELMKW